MGDARDDFRIRRGALRHWKIRTLRERLGADAVLALIELWDFTAGSRYDGSLHGMSDEQIEAAAGWTGPSGNLATTLLSLGLLDGKARERSVHGWADHQPFVAHRLDRIEAARKAGLASAASRKRQPNVNGSLTDRQPSDDAPSTPLPSPSPTPKDIRAASPSNPPDQGTPLGDCEACALTGTTRPGAGRASRGTDLPAVPLCSHHLRSALKATTRS